MDILIYPITFYTFIVQRGKFMNKKILKLTVTAMMIAVCYVGANYIKFDIPTPFGYTKFHLGNTFCILASLLLGGIYGGTAGAIGMSIGDLLDPKYVASAPKTIILKFLMGFIAGSVAHKLFHINKEGVENYKLKVFISAGCGAFMNIILEPCISWFYYLYILGMSEKAAGAFAATKFVTISINAILATIIAPSLYIVLAKRFKKNGILNQLSPKE